MDTVAKKTEDWTGITRNIESLLRQYVPYHYGWKWTSWQKSDEYDDLYAIAMGDKACAFRLSEAANPTDEYIRELAAQILGYPPESLEDYSDRVDYAHMQVATLNAQIAELEKRKKHWMEQSRLMFDKYVAAYKERYEPPK